MKARMVWQCRHVDGDQVCGETFVYYAAAQHHADMHGGARIEIIREYRP